MDLQDLHRRVTTRVQGHDDEDIAVRVGLGGNGSLHVTISSRNPLTYYTQWVDLDRDGTVTLPAPDDGCTSLNAKGTTAGVAATADEAEELVVREVEQAVRILRESQIRAAERALPARQSAVAGDDLAVACEMWQGGRDSGSSRLRGAARALSGVRHYFSAPFISDHETAARTQREALDAGLALLRAVNGAPHLDADGWNGRTGLPQRGFAGRGIAEKLDEDPQIQRQLRTGQIEMPLWGVSLSPAVAAGFGTRFLFELVGDFPAVPAWVHSGIKAEEEELVTGGRYKVLSQEERDGTTHVRLRWIGASGDRVRSDPLLVAVLGAVPGVVHSALNRSMAAPHAETLELRLGGEDSATVTRSPGRKTVEVVRCWALEPGWDAKGDDEYSQWAAMRKASRTTTVPAKVDSIVAAVLRGKENE
jgi:hypothetical protein